MSTAGSNILARRIAVLALSVASFTAVERSHAQVPPANSCSPPAPVNNTNVTCSGTVTNQNAPNGYGTGTETGLTIDVLTGATVSGTQRGIFIDTATVTNNGSISAAGNTDARGISASTDVNVTNFGTITVGDSLTTAVAGVGGTSPNCHREQPRHNYSGRKFDWCRGSGSQFNQFWTYSGGGGWNRHLSGLAGHGYQSQYWRHFSRRSWYYNWRRGQCD